jgi:hypothetical protein
VDQETDYVVPPEEGDEGDAPEEAVADEPADVDDPSAEELVEDADALETEAEVEDSPVAQEVLDEEEEREAPVEEAES